MYSIDSRTINPGDIFIPVKGENFDGHNYIKDVLSKGASKVMDVDLGEYAKYYRKNKLNARVIGVTGSAGKTTVKDMLAEVLATKYRVHKTPQNQNNQVGLPLTILNAPVDTEFLILEMGMRARGEIRYLTDIASPEAVLISSVGSTHIELLGSLKNIALAKAEIFAFKKDKNKEYFTCLNKKMNFFELINNKAISNRFKVVTIDESDAMLSNKLLIINLVQKFGIAPDIAEAILKNFKAQSSHRQLVIKWGQATIIDDTYNANPESMVFAINKLKKEYFNKKKVIVFGEMRELGKLAAKYHRELVEMVCKDNDIKQAVFLGDLYKKFEKNSDKCYYFTDKENLAEFVKSIDKENAVILFKASRGVRMEEVIEDLIKES